MKDLLLTAVLFCFSRKESDGDTERKKQSKRGLEELG
jgi:hypothetical protein